MRIELVIDRTSEYEALALMACIWMFLSLVNESVGIVVEKPFFWKN